MPLETPFLFQVDVEITDQVLFTDVLTCESKPLSNKICLITTLQNSICF